MLKEKVKQFLKWNVTNPIKDEIESSARRHANEILYQSIFDKQCGRHGIKNDFYPLGAAANFSLMYVLARLFEQYRFNNILEFGSGQTTLLIDRVKQQGSNHICYEHIHDWYLYFEQKIQDVDYRFRELSRQSIGGRDCLWYRDVDPQIFDLLLVDGPHGADKFSRVGCIDVIEQNSCDEFVIIIDDTHRRGEQQTANLIINRLEKRRKIYVAEFLAIKGQTLIATSAFRQAAFY